MNIAPPTFDCHAHIAPDVTSEQLQLLGNVFILAVTRTLEEAEAVSHRSDGKLLWGCGVHPAVPAARDSYDANRFKRLLSGFALVGEVGMDSRGGDGARQESILRSILELAAGAPVLISIHSAGYAQRVVDVVKANPHPGAILHWFLGTDDDIDVAVRIGCYFSVNGAMTDDQIRRLPLDRLLPETDYPSTRRGGGGRQPGDVEGLTKRVAQIHGLPHGDVAYRWHRNLLSILTTSGALDRLPAPMADALLAG